MNLTKKRLSKIVLVLFVVSLIPLLIISLYNHPSNDDYFFGVETYQTLSNGGSFFDLLSSSFSTVSNIYHSWQGTFSAIFLFTLQPAVFGDGFYVLSTVILIGFFVFSSLLVCKALLIDHLNCDKHTFLLITLPVICLSIQMVPGPVQSFFWWNGSIYYTFFYALALILFSLILFMLKTQSKAKRWIYFSASLLLAAFIGGGNYVTALLCALLLGCLTLYQIIKRRHPFLLSGITIVFLISFVTSMLAPGNAMRAARYPENQQTIVSTIQKCFDVSVDYIVAWINPVFVVTMLAVGVLLFGVAKKSTLSFKHPFLVLLITFLLFSAQFAPAIYGMGTVGEDRILNIIYFSLYWCVGLNLFYFSGFLFRKYGSVRYDQLVAHLKKRSTIYALVFVCAALFRLTQFGNDDMFNCYTSVSATHALATGQATLYDKEYDERLMVLLDSSQKEVAFKPFTKVPFVLSYGGLMEDINWEWCNVPMAKYYNKTYIDLKE